MLSCATSFAKEDSLSEHYRLKALKFSDRFTGLSKESLIFKGNTAWFEYNPQEVEKSYRLITELYPDDPERLPLLRPLLRLHQGRSQKGHRTYEKAKTLGSEYYPIYRDMAYSIAATQNNEKAIEFLQNYIREYPDNPGADYARQTIAELLGV